MNKRWLTVFMIPSMLIGMGTNDFEQEISDQEFAAIIEYLMNNYRQEVSSHPGLLEYCEQEVERIEQKEKE